MIVAMFLVDWIERVPHWCQVDAENEEEAIAKVILGEVIEGSQDSGIGKMDNRTITAREEGN